MADSDNTNKLLGLFDTFSGDATASGDCEESDDDNGVSDNESDFDLGSSEQELDSDTDTESNEVGHRATLPNVGQRTAHINNPPPAPQLPVLRIVGPPPPPVPVIGPPPPPPP